MKRWVSAVLTVAAVGGLAGYIWANRAAWAEVRLESPAHLAACGVAMAAAVVAPGPIFLVMVNKFVPRVGFAESTYLAVATTGINVFVPFHAGAAFRAVYLKRRHGLDLTAFAATFFGYNVLRLMVAAAAALAAAGWFALGDPRPELDALAAVAGGCLAVAVAACLVPRSGEPKNPVLRRLAAFGRGWDALRRPPAFLARMVGLVAAQFAAELAALWAAYAAVGMPLDAPAVVLIGAFGVLAALSGVTPNGLGVYEFVVAAVGAAVAVDPVRGVAAALVARGVLAVVLLVAAPVVVLGLARDPVPATKVPPAETA